MMYGARLVRWLVTASVVLAAHAVPATLSVNVGNSAAPPGGSAQFSVTLTADAGEQVATVQNDITFDPQNAPVAAKANHFPDCAANPAIGKGGVFTFFLGPDFCDASRTVCDTVLAAVVSAVAPITTIPTGTVLYTCTVAVPADAVPGEYPLTVSELNVGDPQGRVFTEASARGGVFTVLPPGPTLAPTATAAMRTATPTGTPIPASTASPTATNSPTRNPTPTPSPTASRTSAPSPTPPAPTATVPACTGDCDASGVVTVNETLTLVDVALGGAPLSACPRGDANGDGKITVDEILGAIANALDGCPP